MDCSEAIANATVIAKQIREQQSVFVAGGFSCLPTTKQHQCLFFLNKQIKNYLLIRDLIIAQFSAYVLFLFSVFDDCK